MVIPNYWMTHTKLANSTMIRIVSFAALRMPSKWRSFSTRRSHLPPLHHQWLYDVDSIISMNGEITWCRFHAFLSMRQHRQFSPSAHCKLKSDRSLEAHSGRGGTVRNHHGIPLNSHSRAVQLLMTRCKSKPCALQWGFQTSFTEGNSWILIDPLQQNAKIPWDLMGL